MTRRRKPMLLIGPLSANSSSMRHHVERQDFSCLTRDPRFCNASMATMTAEDLARVLPKEPMRPGSQDHRRYQSRGF